MKDSIYSKIKTLPSLDDTVVKIQRVCSDENGSISDLTKIIEKDPMLTANILHSANSPLYGFSKEVANVARAISLFGMATVRGFALSSAIKRSFSINLEPYGITSHDFLNISIMQNALMYNWYSKIRAKDLEILSPASFMLEIGKIVLARELIDMQLDANFKTRLKTIFHPSDLIMLENEFLEITNEEVTAKIFEQWNLESELVGAILHPNEPENAPKNVKDYACALKVVKTAVNIFNQLDETSIQNTLPLLDEYGFQHDTFMMAIAKVKDNL